MRVDYYVRNTFTTIFSSHFLTKFFINPDYGTLNVITLAVGMLIQRYTLFLQVRKLHYAKWEYMFVVCA